MIFEYVSPKSPHYFEICVTCAESRFSQGVLALSLPEKKEHYRRSLEYAFQSTDRATKLTFILRVYRRFCESPESRFSFLELLPVEWLDWLHIMYIYGRENLFMRDLDEIGKILKDICALKPGFLVEYFQDIKILIGLKIVSAELINARNAFFTALAPKGAELKPALKQEDVEALLNLANEAEEQGYVNAFYDLGHFIDIFNQKEGNLLIEVADEVFESVSPLSSYYEWVCIRLAENKFNLARFDSTQRSELLYDSLKFAIDIKDDNKRLEAIQRVASLYIFGTQYSLHALPIPDEQLLLMRERNSINSYLQYFDKVKELIQEIDPLQQNIAMVIRFSSVGGAAPRTLAPETTGTSIEPPKM